MSGENILDLLDKYSITIGGTSYPPFLFIWAALFLFIVFSIKVIIYSKVDKSNRRKQKFWMLVGRQALCYLFSIVVSFSLTCIFGNSENILLNYIICPIVGYLSHFIFNNKILGPMDVSYGIARPTKDTEKKSDTNDGNEKPIELQDIIETKINPDYIDDSMPESNEYNYIVKERINKLIDFNRAAVVEYNKITEELKMQTDILNAIGETMKDELKLKLEKMIYQCLNQGYATPEQNKSITTMYHNYVSLGGNGEIKELYEKHYLKLQVHDGRKNQPNKSREKK